MINNKKLIKLKKIAIFFISLVFATSIAAFEFNSADATYDFTQTVEILIVDKKGSKLFGMFEPFEMKVTTIPSRFYIAVLGAIERGHRNAEGVALVEGAVSDYVYAVMFRSLDRSHILLVGDHWIVDGNKKIFLLPEEIAEIYDVLKRRSDALPADDLSKWEPLFKEINEQQSGAAGNETGTADIELRSIAEARKSIQDRLPAGHNDVQNLPYYNKALENEQFRESQEKLKDTQEEKSVVDITLNKVESSAQNLSSSKSNVPALGLTLGKVSLEDAGSDANNIYIWIVGVFVVIGVVLLGLRKPKS